MSTGRRAVPAGWTGVAARAALGITLWLGSAMAGAQALPDAAETAPTRALSILGDAERAELQRRLAAPPPAKATPEQLKFWETALQRVAQSPEWIALVQKSGNKPIFRGREDSQRYFEAEWKATTELATALGLAAK